MKARDIIVIGTSAGGLSALKKLLCQLPPDLPATVFIVQHMSSPHSSKLPDFLERAGNLKVSHPKGWREICAESRVSSSS